jgi:stage III sporulation protein AG
MKDKTKLLLFFAAVIGIALMLLGSRGTVKTAGEVSAEEKYAAELEEKLLSLCSAVSGVSDCEVGITLLTGFEYEYSSRGEVSAVRYPQVCGVAVVCKGGNVPTIEKELADLIGAVLGISSAQISVSGK